MPLPTDIKEKVVSVDPAEREAAAMELAGYPGEESLDCLILMLSDVRAEVIYAASRSIVSIGTEKAVDALVPLLRSEDVTLRNLAIEIIPRIGAVSISRIVDLLNDKDPDVRKFTVDILRKVNSDEAVDPLIRALYDENVNVAVDAAEILGDIGNNRAVSHLVKCLEMNLWLKCAALRSLGKIGGEEALQTLLSVNTDEDGLVLLCTLTALNTIGDNRGLDYVLGLLEKDNPSLELVVIQTVESMLQNADSETINRVKKALPAKRIQTLLSSNNTGAVRSAISLMGIYKEKDAVQDLARLYTASNTHLFDDLEHALLNIAPSRFEPFISLIEDKTEPDSVKVFVVRLLKKIGGLSSSLLQLQELKEASKELKIEIVEALASLKDKWVINSLHELLKDEDEEVRTATIKSLETFLENRSVSHLLQLSADSSKTVRSTAAKSLRRYDLKGRKQDIKKYLKETDSEQVCFGLEMISKDLLNEFKENIFLLIANKNKKVSICALERASLLDDKRAFEIIIQALLNKDPQVRLAAIRGLEHYPDKNIGEHLIHVLSSDPDEWNRYEAVQVIGRLGLEEILGQMVTQLENSPDVVKAGIIDVIGLLGNKKYLEVVKPYAESADIIVKDAAEKTMKRLWTVD